MKIRRLIWGVAAALAAALGAPAQEVQELQQAVQEGRHADALALLENGWARIPGAESQKKLLQAGLLNRLGRHDEALAGADEALAASGALPADVAPALRADAHLERGAALFGRKEFPAAADALQSALDGGTSRPGEARALLGVTQAALERYDEARESFARAEEDLQEDSVLYESTQEWRRHLDAIAGRRAEEPAGARLRFGAGHSSNPLRFNSDAQLPGGVSGTGSFFYDANLSGWWDAFDDGETKLRLTADPSLRWYESARSFSKFSTRLAAQATHEATEKLTVGGGFAYDVGWLLEPRRKLSRTYEPSVFAEYRWEPWTSTRLSLSHAMTTYYLSGLSGARDPDGAATQARLEHLLALDEEQRYVLVAAVGHAWNSSEGSDWDYRSYDASLALAARPLDPLTLSGGLYAAWYDFEHPNSLSPTGRRRQDQILAPFASATWAITDWFGVTASFSYSRVDSNVPLFEYREAQYSLMPYVDLLSLVGSAFGGGSP